MERRPPRARGPRPRRGEPRRGEAPPEPQPVALVSDLVRRLAPDASGVSVEERVEHGSRVLTVRVESGNVGAIIGRRGRTAQAIRALLGASAAKHRMKIQLQIDG